MEQWRQTPSTEPREPPVLPSSPCTAAGLAGGPGTGSLQGLAPLLLPPGARRDHKTSYQELPPAPWAWLSLRLSNLKGRIPPALAQSLSTPLTLCPEQLLLPPVPPSSQPRSFVSSSCPHSPQRAGSVGTHPPYALAPPRLTCTCAAQGESRGSHHRLPPSMPPAPAWSHLLFKSLPVIPVPVVTDVDGRGGSSWPYLWDNPSTKGMRPIKKGAQPAWETSNGMKNYGHSQQRAEQVGEGSGKCTTGPDL